MQKITNMILVQLRTQDRRPRTQGHHNTQLPVRVRCVYIWKHIYTNNSPRDKYTLVYMYITDRRPRTSSSQYSSCCVCHIYMCM